MSRRLRLIVSWRKANCSSVRLVAGSYVSKGAIAMKKMGMAVYMAAGAILLAASAFPQGEKEGQGQVIVTVMPKHSGDQAASLTAQELTIKVNGKDSKVTNLEALKSATDPVELVVLID